MKLEKQIELLNKYSIENYTVKDGRITINGYLYLKNLTSIPDSNFLKDTTINSSLDLGSLKSIPDSNLLKDTTINGFLDLENLKSIPDSNFLKNTTINGFLYLTNLKSIPDSNFLKNTTINGTLDLRGLQSIPDSNFLKDTTINGSLHLQNLKSIPDSNFLKDTTINGTLDLRGLQSIPNSNFLKNTTINGFLNLRSLKSIDENICERNIKQLQTGYNKNYCFFDGILSKVLKVSNRKGYVIYTTPTGYIAQKESFTAHGLTIKKSIQDLEFKIISGKLKSSPIEKDTIITDNYYRLITGACEQGVKDWRQQNNIEVEEITAEDLYVILKKTNAYGFEKFKSLITF